MKENTLLLAVAQANIEPWLSIWRDGQETTWMSKSQPGVSILNFQSKKTPFVIEKYDFWFEKLRYKPYFGRLISAINKLNSRLIPRDIPEFIFQNEKNLFVADSWSTYQLAGRRNLSLLNYFYNFTRYDFILMSNTSSYFNLNLLFNFIQKFDPNQDLYAGALISKGHPDAFVSGAGRLLSRETVRKVMINSKLYKHDNLEDVCFGNLMRELGIKPVELPRHDITDPSIALSLSSEIINSYFHYRCKSSEIPRRDVEIMKNLHVNIIQKYIKTDK